MRDRRRAGSARWAQSPPVPTSPRRDPGALSGGGGGREHRGLVRRLRGCLLGDDLPAVPGLGVLTGRGVRSLLVGFGVLRRLGGLLDPDVEVRRRGRGRRTARHGLVGRRVIPVGRSGALGRLRGVAVGRFLDLHHLEAGRCVRLLGLVGGVPAVPGIARDLIRPRGRPGAALGRSDLDPRGRGGVRAVLVGVLDGSLGGGSRGHALCSSWRRGPTLRGAARAAPGRSAGWLVLIMAVLDVGRAGHGRMPGAAATMWQCSSLAPYLVGPSSPAQVNCR